MGYEEVVPVPKILWSIICLIKIGVVLRKQKIKIQQHEIQKCKIANTIQLIDHNKRGRERRFLQGLNSVITKFASLSFV